MSYLEYLDTPGKSYYRTSTDGVIIEPMSGPFRFNKKTRKRLRRFAKKVATTADKFETEGTKPIGVATLRFLAESNIAQAKARKKKKPKSPNSTATHAASDLTTACPTPD